MLSSLVLYGYQEKLVFFYCDDFDFSHDLEALTNSRMNLRFHKQGSEC